MSLLDRLKETTTSLHQSILDVKQRALVYIRVSHKDSAERGTSIETQRRDIQAFADRDGIEIVRWFEDSAKSAFSNPAKRVEFQRMIAMAKADPTINLIITWKSDRFSRGQHEPSAIKYELMQYGVRVISVMDNYDPDSISGIVVEKVQEAMNHVRSRELSQVIHRNLTTNTQQRDLETGWAYKNGGKALWGYRNVRIGTNHRVGHSIWLLDDTVTAGKPVHEWARVMLDWKINETVSCGEIARRLTEAGVRTPRGRYGWTASSIYYMLSWDKLLEYAGFGIWNKDDKLDRRRPPSEWIVAEDAHPAIITTEEAEMIEKKQKRVTRDKPKVTRAGRWLLSSRLFCGTCGANFCGTIQKGVDYYACSAHKYRRGAGCGQPWWMKREELETAVIEAISRNLPKTEASLRKMAERINRTIEAEVKLFRDTQKERVAKIGELGGEIGRLTDAIARGVASEAMEEEINRRTAEKRRIEALESYRFPEPVTVSALKAIVEAALFARGSDDLELRRGVIDQWVERIVAYPEKREIELTLKGVSSSISRPPDGGASPSPMMGGKTVLIIQPKRGQFKALTA